MSAPSQHPPSSQSSNPLNLDQQPDINNDLAPENGGHDDKEDDTGDLPMSMSASVMLTHLPKDASQALKEVEEIDDRKGMFEQAFRILASSSSTGRHAHRSVPDRMMGFLPTSGTPFHPYRRSLSPVQSRRRSVLPSPLSRRALTDLSFPTPVSVRFQPIGSAPILKQRVFKISASSRFSVVLNFLRKKLAIKDGDGLFLYVNSVFAPGLDEGVGNLFRVRLCFCGSCIVFYSTWLEGT